MCIKKKIVMGVSLIIGILSAMVLSMSDGSVLQNMSVSAAASGNCGENLTWSFNQNSGILSISGSGKMESYHYYSGEAPWYTYRKKITSITIGNNVTEIGSAAFRECSNLKSVKIPNNITYMGWGIFEKCTSLSTVNIGNGIKFIPELTFSGCTGLTSIVIPNNIQSIAESAFEKCTNLSSIDLSSNLSRISFRAFFECKKLASITIRNKKCEISDSAVCNEYKNNKNIYSGIVYGYSGSTAYTFAQKNGYKFVALDISNVNQYDANGDGKFNVRDAAHIAKMLAQGKSNTLPKSADFNSDGKINVRDSAAMAKYLALKK